MVTPVAASIETVNAVPCWAPFFAVIGGSCSRSQRSRVSVRQIRPRPKRGHEVDRLGRDVVGGEDEIALVLAIFLVDEDHHAAGGQLGDELGNGGDGHG